jgi:hypothetical protein
MWRSFSSKNVAVQSKLTFGNPFQDYGVVQGYLARK